MEEAILNLKLIKFEGIVHEISNFYTFSFAFKMYKATKIIH